jgi:head-tail adaptor
MTPAGKRRERVRFQDRQLDAAGRKTDDWNEGFQRWARVVVRTRGEAALQQRLQGLQPAEVSVLRDLRTAEIDIDWRMVWNGRAYNVRAVAPSEDRAEILILVEADGSDA